MRHPHKEARQQIEELEQQWRAATLSADVATMDRLLSDDYVGISWNGQLNTKAMQIDRTRTRTFALTRLDLLDSKIKIVGNVAIVTARAELDGTSDGIGMKGTDRYTRVYQKLPSGTWKITNFEATRVPDPNEHSHHSR
jgi:ketosteroid isomerase-like protein